jgi:tripartite-type tricarboxylate transporter receptor subunit TctC
MNANKWGTLALCAASLALLCGSAHAQDKQASAYPSRMIKIISPFAPGGATDVLARVIAQKLGESWKQSVIVENKSGGGGLIAATMVARADPDGYTLLLGSVGPVEVLPGLMKKMPYDPEKDLAPVGMLVNVENVLVVNGKIPSRTLPELIAYAKKNPGKLHFGSSGIATTAHLAGEVFKQQAGVDIIHVPYRGGAPAATALLAGEIDMVFSSVPTVDQHIRSGKLRALAVTGEKSIETLPGVLPIKEQGLPGYRLSSWYGLLAPGGTPPAIVDKIHAELGRILAMPEVKATLLTQGWTTAHIPVAQMSRQIHTGIREWKIVTERAGIKPE